MPTEDSRRVATEWIAAFNNGDLDGITGLFAPDVTWWLTGKIPTSGTYEGYDAVVDDFLGAGLPLYEDGTFKLEIINMLAEGEKVAIEWHATAQAKTGKPYDNIYAIFLTVRDGKITSVREHTDTLYVSQTLY